MVQQDVNGVREAGGVGVKLDAIGTPLPNRTQDGAARTSPPRL
jgi:hypothetical protein